MKLWMLRGKMRGQIEQVLKNNDGLVAKLKRIYRSIQCPVCLGYRRSELETILEVAGAPFSCTTELPGDVDETIRRRVASDTRPRRHIVRIESSEHWFFHRYPM